MRQDSLRCLLGVVILPLLFANVSTQAMAGNEPVIHITARKFEYSLPALTVKKGVPVVIEITALDRVHGFNLPEFGVRADAVPGKVTRIRFTPTKAGEFSFFCDVFCGDGHEEMSGVLTVKD